MPEGFPFRVRKWHVFLYWIAFAIFVLGLIRWIMKEDRSTSDLLVYHLPGTLVWGVATVYATRAYVRTTKAD